MASNMKNPFALLDAVGDDDMELTLPPSAKSSSTAVSSPSQGTPPLPRPQSGRQKGKGVPDGQQNSLLKNKEGSNSQAERNGYRPYEGKGYQLRGSSNGYGPHNGRGEGYNHGRGNVYQQQNIGSSGTGKGYGRYNGRSEGYNHGRGDGYQQQNIGSPGASNGYSRYNGRSEGYDHGRGNGYQQQKFGSPGKSNGYGRYNGRREGYNHGRSNAYLKQNIGSPGNKKNSIHEQNGSDSLKPSTADSSGTLHNGNDQGEWQTIRGRRKIIFNEDNQHKSHLVERDSGSSEQKLLHDEIDQGEWITVRGRRKIIYNEDNQSNLVETDSRSSEEKFTPQKFHGGYAIKTGNRRFDSSWQSNNIGGNSGNWSDESRSVARRPNGAVNIPNSKETPAGTEVPVTNNGESANMERKEIIVDKKEAEPKGRNEDRPALTRESKDQMEEMKRFITLREYEKQLLEKRKALESLKAEERKVAMDKEFESMQLVGRKKEGFGLENSNSEKQKLKKEDSVEKDEKSKKMSMSIEWMYRTRHRNVRDRAWGRRGVPAEHESEGNPVHAADDRALDVMDSSQFPGLKSPV